MDSPHPMGLDLCKHCGHSETWHDPSTGQCDVCRNPRPSGMEHDRKCPGWGYGEPVLINEAPPEIQVYHPKSRAEGRESGR